MKSIVIAPMARALLFAVCVAGSAACTDQIQRTLGVNPADSAEVAARIKIEHDSYDGSWEARGPMINGRRVLGDRHQYLLRTFAGDRQFNLLPKVQLYVIAHMDEWRYLNQAHSAGIAYDVTRIDREVKHCEDGDCGVTETIGIGMSIEQLRAVAAGPGFDVRLSGRKGYIVMFVPAAYFQGFLIGIGRPPG